MRIFYTLCIVANILIALTPEINQGTFIALHSAFGWTAALFYFLSYKMDREEDPRL